jgi:hypothetical protein
MQPLAIIDFFVEEREAGFGQRLEFSILILFCLAMAHPSFGNIYHRLILIANWN